MIVFGLLAGRWWKTALLVGTIGWVAVLLVNDVFSTSQFSLMLGAAFFGLINTGVGVAIHQGVLRLVRSRRSSHPGAY